MRILEVGVSKPSLWPDGCDQYEHRFVFSVYFTSGGAITGNYSCGLPKDESRMASRSKNERGQATIQFQKIAASYNIVVAPP